MTESLEAVVETPLLLIDPVVACALPAHQLLILKPEFDLLLGIVDAVAAVADVAANIDRVVSADGAWAAGERVRGAEDGTAGLDGIAAFPDHGADGAGVHVCCVLELCCIELR